MIYPIVLAAGFSSRFGGNKLLAKLRGRPLYRYILERLILLARNEAENEERSVCEYPLVVTQYEEIRSGAEALGASAVLNPDPVRGMSSSIRVGAETVSRNGLLQPEDYLVFFTGDMPDLTEETIRSFFRILNEKKPHLAAISAEGVYGIPAAFSVRYLPELLALSGDRGGKSILRAHPEELYLMEADPAELRDYDLRTDFS